MSRWFYTWLANSAVETSDAVNTLSGRELNFPIYPLVFLLLFAAKVWGILAWPWWAVFAPLVAALLFHLAWWVGLFVVHLSTYALRIPPTVLVDWARGRKPFGAAADEPAAWVIASALAVVGLAALVVYAWLSGFADPITWQPEAER